MPAARGRPPRGLVQPASRWRSPGPPGTAALPRLELEPPREFIPRGLSRGLESGFRRGAPLPAAGRLIGQGS